MNFWKYSGAGNDFVVFDGAMREKLTPKLVNALCDRRNGIGADGLLCISEEGGEVNFKMNYFNADGCEVEMCGNGARACVHWFCVQKNLTSVTFKTANNSVYRGKLLDQNRAEVTMNECSQIGQIRINDFFDVQETLYLNTGVPHAVFLLRDDQDLEDDQWIGNAPKVRFDKRFAKGVNVNFAKKINQSSLVLRTYERGVEGETLACGTGAMALARMLHQMSGEVQFEIHVRGGILRARFDEHDWWLSGPITEVFNGRIDLAKILQESQP